MPRNFIKPDTVEGLLGGIQRTLLNALQSSPADADDVSGHFLRRISVAQIGHQDLQQQICQADRWNPRIEAAYMDVWTGTDGGKFMVFSSVVDNGTSDGTVVQPQW